MSLDTRTVTNLKGVHPKLVAVVKRAYELLAPQGIFPSVIAGVRTLAEQKALYAQGRTKPGPIVTWTLASNHIAKPDGYGHAVDSFPGTWTDVAVFTKQYKAFMQAASELKTPIRWGGDWDRDGVLREKGETDSPHFELWG